MIVVNDFNIAQPSQHVQPELDTKQVQVVLCRALTWQAKYQGPSPETVFMAGDVEPTSVAPVKSQESKAV